MPYYCELCGREVIDERLLKSIVVEGALLRVCPSCYQKFMKQRADKTSTHTPVRSSAKIEKTRSIESRWRKAKIPRRILEEEFEIVPDYAKRIREARERLGWSTKVLAEKVREKESIIKRIEAGRLKPSIQLARKLEKILNIKLLEPIVEENIGVSRSDEEDYFTIGDLIRIKTSKK